MSMGSFTGEVEYGVGRYGLRTFRPAIVRGEPYLVSVSQNPIPGADPRFNIPPKWREYLTDSHPISWADGTCTAVCTRKHSANRVYNWGGDLVATLHEQLQGEPEPHEPPVRDCGCGIYALDDLKHLYEEYRNYATSIVAVISASGRTLEMSRGIRTQHARVVAYWVLDHRHDCRCSLCVTQNIQLKYIHGSREYGNGSREYGSFGEPFSYLQCCQTQFPNATRWSEPEPDDMAIQYGLKATPIPRHMEHMLKVKIQPRGGGAATTNVDLSPILNHPSGAQGHYTFEIPLH